MKYEWLHIQWAVINKHFNKHITYLRINDKQS